MDVFHIKQGATGPALFRVLRDAAGQPLELAGATVTFWMGEPDGVVIIAGGACAVVSETPGGVRFDWQPGDTDVSGRFRAEFVITYADATSEVVPNPDYIDVRIARRVGPWPEVAP